jgi:hypothetical protein
MSWIASAHAQWHAIYGQNEVCPLDCGVNEGLYDEAQYDDDWADAQQD